MHKLYTKSHDLGLLKTIDNDGEIFSPAQHAAISIDHYKDIHKSYENTVRYFFSERPNKLKDITLLKQCMGDNPCNVLSLGAGDCTLEHFLEYALPKGSKVTSTDFDYYVIGEAQKLFDNIRCETFDFFKDKVADLDEQYDVAYFLASAYVMSDEQYVNLLNDLKQNGVKKIIDICGGVMTLQEKLAYYSPVTFIKRNNAVRKIMGKPPIDDLFKGKFHGYMRSPSELRKIYQQTEPKKVTELSYMSHKYIAIIEF